MTSSQQGVAVRTKKQKWEKSDSLKRKEHEKSESGKNSAKKQKRAEKRAKKILHIYKTNQNPPPPKGVGEGRVEARILQTNALYSIQGPCFMDNEGST
jgi:hypothetical protein